MESYTRENTMHYLKYHGKEPLTFIDVTPNPTDKEMMEFLPSDEL
jgi:hypothetical protein